MTAYVRRGDASATQFRLVIGVFAQDVRDAGPELEAAVVVAVGVFAGRAEVEVVAAVVGREVAVGGLLPALGLALGLVALDDAREPPRRARAAAVAASAAGVALGGLASGLLK